MTFPTKLFHLLSQVDEEINSILSWMPAGNEFCIHKPKEFVSTILCSWFNKTKWTSFQRQLNLYKFSRSRICGVDYYYHEHFHRDFPQLVTKIRRPSTKNIPSVPRQAIERRNYQQMHVPPSLNNSSMSLPEDLSNLQRCIYGRSNLGLPLVAADGPGTSNTTAPVIEVNAPPSQHDAVPYCFRRINSDETLLQRINHCMSYGGHADVPASQTIRTTASAPIPCTEAANHEQVSKVSRTSTWNGYSAAVNVLQNERVLLEILQALSNAENHNAQQACPTNLSSINASIRSETLAQLHSLTNCLLSGVFSNTGTDHATSRCVRTSMLAPVQCCEATNHHSGGSDLNSALNIYSAETTGHQNERVSLAILQLQRQSSVEAVNRQEQQLAPPNRASVSSSGTSETPAQINSFNNTYLLLILQKLLEEVAVLREKQLRNNLARVIARSNESISQNNVELTPLQHLLQRQHMAEEQR